MGLRERESGAVGRVLKGRTRRRRIEIRRRTGIKRKWQSRLVLWPKSPTARVRLTPSPFAENRRRCPPHVRHARAADAGAVPQLLSARQRRRAPTVERRCLVEGRSGEARCHARRRFGRDSDARRAVAAQRRRPAQAPLVSPHALRAGLLYRLRREDAARHSRSHRAARLARS